ncbi:type I-D CRISPR-associated protein Cas7/Csc2 [Sulfolobus sp. S-194]|uniref:type I-D CRISPR-associated protein Cas7/Csc2 n=1 Tax=Sulfolobus sp. S-194 TaxID=2512240 RepID=UPI0014370F93|nr:type I-D CRISPR-associated protein Cas7/Csc2 [Sulfolobus sp. S-194]QIW22848.1 type I-D CRISPR-associated protein Cas7/Csc2 [Sulfolobus sp. S-194]
MSKAEELFKNIFGVEFNQVKPFFSDLSKPDVKNVVPQGRVINVYIVIRANNELLIRHEGGEDISLASIGQDKYPIILYDKFQSVYRRKELEFLRNDYSAHKAEINKIRGKEDDWFCALRPTVATKKEEERMGGQCGECPDCITFGFAVRKEGRYNVKSRIEGDLFIATTSERKSVVIRTFNAVDDITKTTIIGGESDQAGRTGALFRLSLVRAGTAFVGKIAMKDIGPNDFLLKIATLTTISKIGGNITDFGNIKVYIPAIMFSTHEISSSYDLFLKVKEKEDVDTIISDINAQLDKMKKGVLVTSNDFSEKIKSVLFDANGRIVHDVIQGAWEEAKIFKDSIEAALKEK